MTKLVWTKQEDGHYRAPVRIVRFGVHVDAVMVVWRRWPGEWSWCLLHAGIETPAWGHGSLREMQREAAGWLDYWNANHAEDASLTVRVWNIGTTLTVLAYTGGLVRFRGSEPRATWWRTLVESKS